MVEHQQEVLKTLLFLVFWAVGTVASGNAAADIGKSVRTRAGELTVATATSKTGELTATLKLGGQVIFQTADEPNLALERHYSLPDKDVVLFSTDAGGSGTWPTYGAIVVRAGSPAKVLTNGNFYSNTGVFKPQLVGAVVQVDLGFENKQRKEARIEGDRLSVGRWSGQEVAALPRSDCDWLYGQVLNDCRGLERKQCPNAMFEISMSSQRGVRAMENKPGFDAAVFEQQCVRTCENSKKPARPEFGRAVCGAR